MQQKHPLMNKKYEITGRAKYNGIKRLDERRFAVSGFTQNTCISVVHILVGI